MAPAMKSRSNWSTMRTRMPMKTSPSRERLHERKIYACVRETRDVAVIVSSTNGSRRLFVLAIVKAQPAHVWPEKRRVRKHDIKGSMNYEKRSTSICNIKKNSKLLCWNEPSKMFLQLLSITGNIRSRLRFGSFMMLSSNGLRLKITL